MEEKRKKTEDKTVSEEDKDSTAVVYYYCPHCRESHDPVKNGENPDETRCPVCGEVYPLK